MGNNIRSSLFVLFTVMNFVSIVLLYNHYYHPFTTQRAAQISNFKPHALASKPRTHEVTSNNITYVGLKTRHESVEVIEFLGLPYARPPLGPLRHRSPEPLDGNHKTTVNGLTWPASCLQPDNRLQLANGTFSEDCLYLNIWTPLNASNKPVLVLIHTGAFVFGSSAEKHYNGRVLAALADIVVVSFNYRLNYFGFAYAKDPELVTPNVGMLDQVAALGWIRHNIAQFGGDPARLTLIGQSSGGLSVGMHISSPLSGHLFQQAILLSGSPLQAIDTSEPTNVEHFWKRLAMKLNCSKDDDSRIDSHTLQCLDAKLANDRNLMPTMETVKHLSSDRLFVNIPVVAEGKFQPKPQTQLLERFNGSVKSILYGFTDDEGSWIAALEDKKHFGAHITPKLTQQEAQNTLRQYLNLMGVKKDKEIIDYYLVESYNDHLQQAMTNASTGEEDDSVGDGEEEEEIDAPPSIDTNVLVSRLLTSSLGDNYIVCPLNRFAQQLASKGVSVHQYHWRYKGNARTSRFWNVFENVWCARWMGACHSFEMYALFGVPIVDRANFDRQDRIVSYKMIEIVRAFLHNNGQLFWPGFDDNKRLFYQIDASLEKATYGQDLKMDVCNRLWS